MDNLCSVSSPSVAFGATSPLQGRIARWIGETGCLIPEPR
jgi:hypothetical protein